MKKAKSCLVMKVRDDPILDGMNGFIFALTWLAQLKPLLPAMSRLFLFLN